MSVTSTSDDPDSVAFAGRLQRSLRRLVVEVLDPRNGLFGGGLRVRIIARSDRFHTEPIETGPDGLPTKVAHMFETVDAEVTDEHEDGAWRYRIRVRYDGQRTFVEQVRSIQRADGGEIESEALRRLRIAEAGQRAVRLGMTVVAYDAESGTWSRTPNFPRSAAAELAGRRPRGRPALDRSEYERFAAVWRRARAERPDATVTALFGRVVELGYAGGQTTLEHRRRECKRLGLLGEEE